MFLHFELVVKERLRMSGNVIEQNNLQDLATKTLENVRKKLLDLTARNRLLNFRETAKTIRIVDELPNQVFDILVHQNRAMEIIAYEPPKEDDDESIFNEFSADFIEKNYKKYGVTKKQASFIVSKVKELNNIEDVNKFYVGSTKVSLFAKDFASKLYSPELEEAKGILETNGTIAEEDAKKYGLTTSRIYYIREKVKELGSFEDVQQKYAKTNNTVSENYRKYAIGYDAELYGKTTKNVKPNDDIDLNRELPKEQGKLEEKHIDRYLQTPFISKQLEKKCVSVTRDYKSAISETGANLLYLAIGFLEWVQDENSSKKFKAPLVLVPITITRKRVNRPENLYSFEIEFSSEYIEANLSLAEMLDKNFGLKLPEWNEETNPEEYFNDVARVISDKDEWSIHREMVIGFFSFAKLRIYKDLDANVWPEGCGPLTNSSVAELLVGRDLREQTGLQFGEFNPDNSPEADKIPLVMKADGSQLETIHNILHGDDNVVVHGPPGTGKSQTIANLIAAALSQSKKILFVSEKKAALEVVKKRLDSVNLGDFCLELHSHLTKKGQLHRDLESRLNKYYSGTHDYRQKIEERKRHRKRLLDYYNALIQKRGKIDKSAYEIFGEAEKWRSELGSINFEYEFENCLELTQVDLNVTEEEICEYAELLSDFTEDTINAWTGFSPQTILPGDENKVSDALTGVSTEINKIVAQAYSVGFDQSFSFGAAQSLAQADFDNLPGIPQPWDQNIAPLFADNKARKSIQDIIRLVAAYNSLKNDSENIFGDIELIAEVDFHSIAKATAQLENLGFGAWTVINLKNMAHVQEQVKTKVNDIQEATIDGSELFFNFSLSLENCDRICGLSDYLESLSPTIALHAYPEHASQLARQYFDEATGTYQTLSKQIEELSQYFYVNEKFSDGRIKEIIEIFSEQPGMLGRLFSSRYKGAKRDYLSLCKPQNKAKPVDSIENLSALAHLLERIEKFKGNHNYTAVFGPLFNGIETDWDVLSELVKSSRKIANLLGSDSAGKRFLKNLDLNKEKILRSAEYTRIQKRELDFLLKKFFAYDEIKSTPLDEIKSSLQKLINDADEWIPVLDRFHDRDDVKIFEITTATNSAIKSKRLLISLRHDTEYKTILGNCFCGEKTDIKLLDAMNSWISFLVEKQNCDEKLLSWLLEDETEVRITSLGELIRKSDTGLNSISHNLEVLKSLGPLDKDIWFNGNMNQCSLDVAGTKISQCLDNISYLQRWSSYQNIKHKLADRGLSRIIAEIENRRLSAVESSSLYKYVMFNSMARELVRNNNEFREFQGPVFEQIRNKLKSLEAELEHLSQSTIAKQASLHEVPRGVSYGRVRDYTELSLIRHEIGKKRAHIPVRQLVKRSVKALQALKPCFMMSPMSVAQYLDPGAVLFDLVIMDEASQLRLEDALGVVLRGKQIVVVGDPKQLPPTSFFDRQVNIDSEDETIADNAESILDVAQNCFPNSHLRWHYRSEDERLIAFSNAQFYDGELVIFPTPAQIDGDTGVFHHYIENSYSQKGAKGGVVNRQEAANVAEAIKKHFKRYDDLSLGVATFNVNQSELIQDELDRLCREDKWLEERIKRWDDTPDSFFIKNLENVQGDERDVIFISTTYGPDKESGQVYQRFGPINSATGWRRLNVIVTRAKKQIHLFTSLKSSDIKITAGSQQGVVALKNYLEFLETGKIPEWGEVNPDRGPDSSFEIAVANALNNRGYRTAYQVGVAGFFIDIGVYHPDHDGEFLLGIECDGATYHSAKSVRDRDILRQSILESKGWNIHRIWSTDWFKSRDNEIEKMLQILDRLVASSTVKAKPRATKEELTADYKPEHVAEAVSQEYESNELRAALLEFRKDKIEPLGSDLDTTILSDLWIDHFLNRKPTTREDFSLFPLEQREKIKNGTQYLDDILELIEDFA